VSHTSEGLFGTFDVFHQHFVAFISPQRRQETEVSPDLSSGMGCSEVCQITGQCYVVFRIEYKQFHFGREGTKI
jgi:hypothetical protein